MTAILTGGPFGYMVGQRDGRAVGVAELDGTNGWQVYHAGVIIRTGLTRDEAADVLRTLPTPERIDQT